MAWLDLDASGNYHLSFRLGKRRFKRSLKTTNKRDAEHIAARLEENISLVERGRLEIPPEADAACFLLSDGKITQKIEPKRQITLKELFKAYFAALPEGSLEESTIEGMEIHERHLYRILGETFKIQQLTTEKLQSYIEKRSREPGLRGNKVTPTTIKKPIVTLRTLWNWGVTAKHLVGTFPGEGLIYPKAREKAPFQTWAEIERQIERGGLTRAEEAELWDCLFLTLPEIADLLDHVQTHARLPFIYPMFVFAAHTGARRSEMIRSRLTDIDLEVGMITIRERKRSHTQTTTRRVPISGVLRKALADWLARHPGGAYTFCHGLEVPHSKKARAAIGQLTGNEAHDHFKRTLLDSKWEKLHGWHCLRHTFASNCAAKGIDQRIINSWMGHQTEAMVRRYRHLFPNQEQSAMQSVFGSGLILRAS